MSESVPNDAARVIEAFGGIRPMAKKLGVAVTTVQGWKERNAIPIRRLDELRAAAQREGIDLGALAVPKNDAPDDPSVGGSAAPPGREAPPAAYPARDNQAPDNQARDNQAGTGPVEAEPMRAEKVVNTPSGVRESAGTTAGPTVDAAPAQPAGRNRAFAFGLGFAGMLALGALIGWAVATQFGGTGPDRETAAALEQRIAAAENSAAEARSAATAAGSQAAALAQRLKAAETAAEALAGKIEARNDGTALKALGDSVAALKADLEALRRTVAAVQADERPAKLAADLAGLRESVAELRKAAAEAAGRTAGRDGEEKAVRAALGDLSQGLEALSDRVAALDPNRLANAEKALSGLTARLAAAETRMAALKAGGGAAGTVVALSQLRAAAASGRPYGAALAVARTLAGGNESAAAILTALEPAAAGGAPVLPVLQREFDALSARLVAAADPAQGESWAGRAWNRLKSTVVVRRTGRRVTGDSIPALVAQAEVRLADGDLPGAIALVRRAPEAAQKTAAEWLAAAERRAGVDAALARLDALMPVLSGTVSGAKSE
ncbi:MAG: hypothetical protein F4160_08195 [Rhodospirillaceae bacterium]|nr:hypothetical protein [Rhodospirillaceae bacterium]